MILSSKFKKDQYLKVLMLVGLFIVTACSSNRNKEVILPFTKEKVCSERALIYLKGKHSTTSPSTNKYSEDDIRSRMLSLEPLIKKCYNEEIERSSKSHSFNLCLVVGYNKKGFMDFFEFSTREIHISNEFQKCLSNLKGTKELIGFKDLSITQPYRLFPKM